MGVVFRRSIRSTIPVTKRRTVLAPRTERTAGMEDWEDISFITGDARYVVRFA